MIYAIQSEVLDRLIDGVSKIGEKKHFPQGKVN